MNPIRHLFGRDLQLAAALAHLDDLDHSRGGLLVLTGEAGIGKTRLAEAIVDGARARGARTAWITAWQGDGAPPLWPWVQILRQLTGSAAALDQAAPETPTASPAARFAQLEVIAGQLLEVAAADRLVVVIDDLHWADAATRRVLTFVASAIRDAPCLLVATCRTGELPRDDVAELARVGITLAIPRLPDGAAADLLRTAVGGEVSAAATEVIVARSGGNPLFVWEFAQLMAQSGRLDIAPAAVPGAVASVIERRLARLPQDAVALLQVAAVVGNPCEADLLGAIAEIATEDAVVGVNTAIAAGLVIETDPHPTFAFSHDLVREVVLDGLEPRRRAELHRRAAAALAGRLRTDTSLHAVVADHLTQAGPAHASAASEHWEQAARGARRVLAYEEAATYLARARDSARDDPDRYGELIVSHGDALLLAGDLEAARASYRRAASVVRAIPNAELLARAVLGIGAGPVAWEVPIASDEHATSVAEALALLPRDATRLRSMLLGRLSVSDATPETLDVARRRAEEALELAEETGDGALIGQALAALNDALGGPSHTMVRRENADTIVELAVAAGDRALELLGYRFLVVADLEAGDIAAVDRDIAAFARLATALRQPLVSWYVPLFQGMRALLAGHLDAAERHHAEVAAAARATGSHNAELLATTLGFGIDVTRGRTTSADLMDGLVVGVDPAAWSSYAAGLAMIKWHAGAGEEARDLLKLHADNGFARLGDDAEHLATLTLFGRVAVGLDEGPAALGVYELLLPHSGLWVVDGIAACCWGPVDLELGRLAIVLGRHDVAREHLAAARTSIEQVGAVPLAAEVTALEQQVGGRADRASAAPAGGDVDVLVERAGTGNLFHREGQFWTLAYQDRTVRMNDAKGLSDLARLLAEPGREFYVLDLAGSGAPAHPVGSRDQWQSADLGELLDARARGEYRRRLAELADELQDAEECADLARANKASEERDFLSAELSAALGLGGRPRRAGDSVERARKAVSGRIRMAIGRIDHEHATLGRHLRNAVRTGTYCVYEPENPTYWHI